MSDATSTKLEPTRATLRPCPWCGEKPTIDEWNGRYQAMHECEGPWGVEIKTNLFWTKEGAVAAWNRRTNHVFND